MHIVKQMHRIFWKKQPERGKTALSGIIRDAWKSGGFSEFYAMEALPLSCTLCVEAIGTDRCFGPDERCMHPGSITCLEIENCEISLIKWRVEVRKDNTLFVKRECIAGPLSLQML